MNNKKAKQMICDMYSKNKRGKVEFCVFMHNRLHAWHYPPCEGGWYISQENVSLTANQLRGIND